MVDLPISVCQGKVLDFLRNHTTLFKFKNMFRQKLLSSSSLSVVWFLRISTYLLLSRPLGKVLNVVMICVGLIHSVYVFHSLISNVQM